MSYLSNSVEYLEFKERYGGEANIIKSAFDDSEVDNYTKVYNFIASTITSKPKREYLLSRVNSELAECGYIRLNNLTSYYRDKRYRGLSGLTGDTSGLDEITSNAVELINTINNSGLPLTDSIVDWVTKYVKVEKSTNKISELASKYHVDYESLMNSKLDSVRNFISLANEVNNLSLMESYFRIACKIVEAYEFVTSGGTLGLSVIEGVASRLYKETLIVKYDDGTFRLATKSEVKNMVAGVTKHVEPLVSQESIKYINTVTWLLTNNNKYYVLERKNKDCNFSDFIDGYLDVIEKALDYIVSEEFIVCDKDKIIKGNQPVKYLDSAEDELTVDVKVVDMVKLIKKELDPEYGDWYSNLAWKIAADAIKHKKYALSEKQYKIIEDNYNKIVYKQEQEGKETKYKATKSNPYKQAKLSDELASKVQIVSEYIKSKKSYKSNSFYIMVLDICERTLKYKKCSEKQENILDKIIADINKEQSKNNQVTAENNTDASKFNGVTSIDSDTISQPEFEVSDVVMETEMPDFLGNIEEMFN